MKHAFVLGAIIISFQSTGQITKKDWIVGGSGNFYSYNQTTSSPTYNSTAKYTTIDISAAIGYFIADKLAVGLTPIFSSVAGKVTGPGGSGSTNDYKLAIGPYVRYYFLKDDRPFNLLTDINYQLGVNQFLGALHEKGKLNTFSIMAGAELFFNNTAGLEILFGYKSKIVSIENSPSMYKNVYNGFQTSIGFQIHLENL